MSSLSFQSQQVGPLGEAEAPEGAEQSLKTRKAVGRSLCFDIPSTLINLLFGSELSSMY